ncbi:hypothetical protein Leryth_015373 [Lithospermum erythrorhizon]|nr:hypothetical protein Leryth_015373 [Lithospermum erythrorhizon]
MSEPSSTPPLPLHNRVAIITGGSRGIGRAISLHLASLGANLVINFLSNSYQANQLVTQINSNNKSSTTTQAICVQADISELEQVKALFDAAESAFNVQPHILVNSAGVADPNYNFLADMEVQDFDYVMKVNVRGTFLCCQEASKRINNGGGGRIICLSSSGVAALRPGNGAYAASKAAVEAMIKILAKELKGTGITANCVAPGPVASEMFFAGKTEEMIKRRVDESPLGRLGQPEDIAPLVGFLASDVGEWVNGQIILANGGYI